MVALKAERAEGNIIGEQGAASGAGQFDIFVDENAVQEDFFKSGVGDFFAVFIKAGSVEDYVKGLPIAGGEGGVDAGGVAFVTFRISFFIPAFVDAATFDAGIRRILHFVSVVNLDFILALEIDAGIGALGNYKFEVKIDIAELGFCENVLCLADGAVYQDAGPGFGREELWIVAIEERVADDLPAGAISPGGEV